MKQTLRDYFPIIRTKEKILEEIQEKERTKNIYEKWTEEQREEFLNFCTGMKGAKILYDPYFKEIFNPETVPERMEQLLSTIIGQNVKVLQVLPNDSTRIADEESLLVTDILVELEDGSLANVEVQKVGYRFPGQRAACYGADLLLRQYKRVRSELKKEFSYTRIKNVYTIVFFEKSGKEFKDYPNTYLHFFQQESDTGLELPLLEKFIFIPLDIFRKNVHNKGIQNKLDAWLAFLSCDEPEEIISLITAYPEYEPLYRHIYDMCQNVERVMELFSEELRIMDKNTVRYMVDQMQEELAELADERKKLQEENKGLADRNTELADRNTELADKNTELTDQNTELMDEIRQKEEEIVHLKKILEEMKEKK